jgi:hypothetical protein
VKPQHHQHAEAVLAMARKRPGVQIVVFDRLRKPKNVAADLRELAKEMRIKAKVKAHANGAVEVVAEA